MLNQGHILSAAEMRSAEEQLIDNGVSVDQLMERAGKGAAEFIWRAAADMPTLILCGPGNNGGDGYVIAEWLRQKDVPVEIAASGEPRTEAARNAKREWQGKTLALKDAQPRAQFVDCLFGTGLTRAVDDQLWKEHQRLAKAARRRVAVDLPSAVTTDEGQMLNDLPCFQMTIALGAYKPAHFLSPAAGVMGDLVGVDIGVRRETRLTVNQRPVLQPPAYDDHKYERGLVAVIAGAMPGAAELAARACQHAGAGYVKYLTAERQCLGSPSIVQSVFANIDELQEQLEDERIRVVLIGPGLGRSDAVREILEVAASAKPALVLDADALFLLDDGFSDFAARRSAPVIATPHGGEFERIASNISGSKLARTLDLATQSRAAILHKGPDTIMASPEGEAAIAATAESWLSTAGTGDVLAGLVAGRMAVCGHPYRAMTEAQWLHNRAAQLAGAAFTPEDLIAKLPTALAECL